MVDYQSVKAYFKTNNLFYYTYYPKLEEPIKAVIRHCLQILLQRIPKGLVDLGFDVISVKQMPTVRKSTEGTTHITLPLFLDDDKVPRLL
jgi:hypothetical protein